MAKTLDRDGDIQNAYQAIERKSAIYEWMKQRSAAVKQNISAHDILRRFGSTLKFSGSDHEEQFSCPFHGKDNKPSARVYPDGPRSPSHVWCFTCQKNWDIFGLWRNFMGHGEDVKFGTIIFELERAYGIVPPEAPDQMSSVDTGPTEAEQDLDQLFVLVENRLREARPKYDFDTFTRTGQFLDRLRYRYDNRTESVESAAKVLRLLVDKIGDRIRA